MTRAAGISLNFCQKLASIKGVLPREKIISKMQMGTEISPAMGRRLVSSAKTPNIMPNAY